MEIKIHKSTEIVEDAAKKCTATKEELLPDAHGNRFLKKYKTILLLATIIAILTGASFLVWGLSTSESVNKGISQKGETKKKDSKALQKAGAVAIGTSFVATALGVPQRIYKAMRGGGGDASPKTVPPVPLPRPNPELKIPKPSPKLDKRGIPDNYDDIHLRNMVPTYPHSRVQGMPIPNLDDSPKTLVTQGTAKGFDGDYIVECPYCGGYTQMSQDQMNCHTIRHGKGLGPHATFQQVRDARNGKLHNCGGPIRIVQDPTFRGPHGETGYGYARHGSYDDMHGNFDGEYP